jgi:hypothetical protein
VALEWMESLPGTCAATELKAGNQTESRSICPRTMDFNGATCVQMVKERFGMFALTVTHVASLDSAN